MFTLFVVNQAVNCQEISQFIHVDQFGYLPKAEKVAVLSDPQVGFNEALLYSPPATLEVRDVSSGQVVFSGSPEIWNNGITHNYSGDKGWWFDFSSVEKPGSYYIFDPISQERSARFQIGEDVYTEVMKAAGRMFFYNRCNQLKKPPFASSKWSDSEAFLQDARVRSVKQPADASLEKDMRGGWFDAGDYNKYVTFTYSTLHNLLSAYEENPEAFTDNWNIPESGNGIPDILDEVKWELDWLIRMVNPDGTVHLKMGSRSHSDNAHHPPSVNTDTRYYAPTCTSASIAVSSIFAHAAIIFKTFSDLSDYADNLITLAVKTWDFVYPFLQSGNLDEDCDDGSVKSGDADWDKKTQKSNALTSAIYLFELTGDNGYSQYISEHLQDPDCISNNNWDNYNLNLEDALLRYTRFPLAIRANVNTINQSFTAALGNNWNYYFGFNFRDLYRAYVPNWCYHWGSNIPISTIAILNRVAAAYHLRSADSANYIRKAAEQLHFFHGVNPLGLEFLTNMYAYGGDRCANEIFHTWFAHGSDWDNALTSKYGPPPGYMPGGPNASYSVNTNLRPPYGQPAQKSYLDFNVGWPDNSWEITEPAIYYQAAYIRFLAYYCGKTSGTGTGQMVNTNPDVRLFPNPAHDSATLSGLAGESRIDIFTLTGNKIKTILTDQSDLLIDTSELPIGIYYLKLSASEKLTTLYRLIHL
ncbi:MAG: glycoside hydrolase family 9 protein [Bacteroidota bacterium]